MWEKHGKTIINQPFGNGNHTTYKNLAQAFLPKLMG